MEVDGHELLPEDGQLPNARWSCMKKSIKNIRKMRNA